MVLVLLAAMGCGDDGSGGAGGEATTQTSTGAGGGGGELGVGGEATDGGGGSGGAGSGGAASGGAASGGSGGGEGGAAPDAYGALSGTCGDIDLEDILAPEAEVFHNALDFSARPMFDPAYLTPDGFVMYEADNLGGSSLFSEIFAFEVLHRCDEATLVKTEGDILYESAMGKKTDILLSIDGEKVGVSVVRAMSFPEGAEYPLSQAFNVLEGKLADILLSSENVKPEDAWTKQILSVLAQTPEHADAITEAYAMVDEATRADTLVVITVTEGDDDFIYYE